MTVTAGRDLGEHAAESASKSDRLIVTGRLRQRSYENAQGAAVYVFEIEAADVGLLRGSLPSRSGPSARRAATAV
jgi:single-strand DNA-binding protein